jgi:hypothetical protein
MHPSRDVWWHDVVPNQRPFCPPVSMNAEDPLFMLYTSGRFVTLNEIIVQMLYYCICTNAL